MSRKGYLDFDTVTTVQTEFEDSATLSTYIEDEDTFNLNLDDASSQDHSKLYNRDKSDAHPISAITDLQDELDSKINADDDLIIECGTSTTNIFEE